MPSVTNYFDLNKSYYILAANGPIFSGSIRTHSFREPSSQMYSFKNGQTTGQYTTTSLSTSTASPIPSNNPQNYSVSTIKISWKDNGDSTDIVMTNSMANNNWFAFGFSNDQSMVNIFIINVIPYKDLIINR
jgi:hypothetical protein